MCVHINSLPDDCLLPIFDRIALSDLLRLDQVCSRWACLLPSACARRRTLVLIFGNDQIDQMNFNIPFNDNFEVDLDGTGSKLFYLLPVHEYDASLRLPYVDWRFTFNTTTFDQFLLNENQESEGYFDNLYETIIRTRRFTVEGANEMARIENSHFSGELGPYLSDLFPNVATLVVIHGRVEMKEFYPTLIDLLGSWSLVTLKLWLYFRDRFYVQEYLRHPALTLLEAISRQTRLQQLTLDICGKRLDITFPVESYSFISQLKVAKLYLGSFDSDNLIWDIVHRFDSTKLRHVGIGNRNDIVHPWYHQDYELDLELDQLEMALFPTFEFTPKVSHLYWHSRWHFETVEQFGEFCWRFASLTTLQMTWPLNISFTELVSNLTLLSELTQLKLKCDLEGRPENVFALVGADGEQLALSLPQIRILELKIKTRSHRDFESLSPELFPSIEVILLEEQSCFLNHGLRMLRCNSCKLENTITEYDYRCHGMLIESLMDKFGNTLVQFYSKFFLEESFIDYWTYQSYYVNGEEDDENLPEIGDHEQTEEEDGD